MIHRLLLLAAFVAAFFLSACGGGGAPAKTVLSSIQSTYCDRAAVVPGTHALVSNAGVGSPFVFVDGVWHTVPAGQSVAGAWVIRGTNEDTDYQPLNPVWFGPSDGLSEPRPYWQLSMGPDGVRSTVDKTATNASAAELAAHSGAFLNDALSVPACLKDRPVITLDYQVLAAAGAQLPLLHIGIPDKFIELGSRDTCLAAAGLDAAGLAAGCPEPAIGQPRLRCRGHLPVPPLPPTLKDSRPETRRALERPSGVRTSK